MTNNELKKVLKWAEKKGKFNWADLQEQFKYDNQKMVEVENVFHSGIHADQNLVDHLFISGENPNLFVITARGRELLVKLQSQKSPLVEIGLLVLGIIDIILNYYKLIPSDLFWIFLGIIAVILLSLYWGTKNSVWGGLTIGLIVGIIISIFLLFKGNIFNWYIVGKGAIIGTILGLFAELLGKISDYLRQK